MVLVRRKDKRRGNEAEEISVASDSSIVANKGVRSLQSARSGRFAADMRVQVGGYGRPDKTWGVDHPWHKTREGILDDVASRDRLEDGIRLQEEEKKQGHGLSRAALKKKKHKMKKGGVAGSAAVSSENGSEAVQTATAVATVESKPQHEPKKGKKKATSAPVEEEEKAGEKEETKVEAGDETKSKKRKRVNRNKKKKQMQAHGGGGGGGADDSDDNDDDDDELDESVEKAAKSKKQKAAELEALPAEVVSPELDKKQKAADAAAREAIATQYESALGHEFTTASGLTIRDIQVGKGRVPHIGEMLTVRYRGRIDDKNGIVFGKGMLTTTYGTGSVIAGWEEGMGTMRAGGVRHLVVPPELGYGATAKGGKIPANATLFFEVELVRMGKRKRDNVAKDDVPLPSAFQRKRTPSASTGKDNHKKNATQQKSKPKGRRRKHSI